MLTGLKIKYVLMIKILSALLLFIVISCQTAGDRKGIAFSIENKSDHAIEYVRFTTSEHLHECVFDLIQPNDKVFDFLNMQENQIDGSYVLEFNRKGKSKTVKSFGYYTNGGPLDKRVSIQIKNDTILSDFKGIPY